MKTENQVAKQESFNLKTTDLSLYFFSEPDYCQLSSTAGIYMNPEMLQCLVGRAAF